MTVERRPGRPRQDPAIEIAGLRVERGATLAIDDLHVRVPRGQITGLLGPSGCGKTTLMRAIVGAQRIAAGTVRVLGHTAGAAELRRRVGYVTQAPSVYPDLTVGENLHFFASVLGVDGDAEVRAAADVGLADRTSSLVGRLSGGQRSRVSLAVALLAEPDLLILDEPTVGLDPVLRRQLWGTFADLAASGRTLVVSSHVMDEAARCDRLILMRSGRLLADDTLEGVLNRTGASDVESGFITLIEEARTA